MLMIDLQRRDTTPGAATGAVTPVKRQLQPLQIDDQLTYTIEDLFTRQSRTVTVAAPLMGPRALASQQSHGGQLGDFDLLAPPGGWQPQGRLNLGLFWSVDYTASDTPPPSRLSLKAQVMRREQVTTPAGRFQTLMIEYTGTAYRTGANSPQPQPTTIRLWVDSDAGVAVRFESEVLGGMAPPGRPSRERMELSQWTRSAPANPPTPPAQAVPAAAKD
jgi:hypothetical protein